MKCKTTQTCPPAAVCVLTGRGMAAIATVALVGPEAENILGRIFSRPVPVCGQSAYGTLQDGHRPIDSVVAACEGQGRYMIHCHGNPLLVEQVVRLCERLGARPQQSRDFLFEHLHAESKSLIETQARLEMTRAATLEGVKLLSRQISGGLSAWATQWINAGPLNLERLRQESRDILRQSQIAGRLLHGVRIVLVGAPNCGKSTLLNWLAQDAAALVSDTAGTTRDWVSTVCRIGPLRAETIDTAGIDPALAERGELDRAAQAAALQMMQNCDLILCIQDCTQPITRIPLPPGVPVLNVLSKIDLLPCPQGLQTGSHIPVSAKTEYGLQDLCDAILALLEIDTLSYDMPIAFTPTQQEMLDKLVESDTESAARKTLAALFGESGD